MTGRRVGLGVVVVGLVASGAIAAWGGSNIQDRFPHLRHQRLFPSCEGCHRIESTGVTIPEPSLCAGCHNGQIVPRVEWAGPSPEPSNLDFDHADVLAAKRRALGFDMPCKVCHNRQGAERMDVVRAVVDGCIGCHAPGDEHRVGAPCETCHVPLTEATGYTTSQIFAFPRPPDHETDEFAMGHGALARASIERCAVCHAREFCSNCHVDAPRVPEIQALKRDRRVAEGVRGRTPVYPVPEWHQSAEWLSAHGASARAGVAACITCHARNSCETCHVPPLPAPVQRLPSVDRQSAKPPAGDQERGAGVRLERRPPPSHTPVFSERHKVLAAAATSRCETCHTRNQCSGCHTGSETVAAPGRPVSRYHPENFMQQHSAAAFGRSTECASCHNTEAFCRDCHSGQDRTARGRIDTGFHDGKPTWVFGHGQAARQDLESCAACHAQRDCLTCHSALGGRRVNPHGPGFDAERLRSKNPAMCLRCHFQSILEP